MGRTSTANRLMWSHPQIILAWLSLVAFTAGTLSFVGLLAQVVLDTRARFAPKSSGLFEVLFLLLVLFWVLSTATVLMQAYTIQVLRPTFNLSRRYQAARAPPGALLRVAVVQAFAWVVQLFRQSRHSASLLSSPDISGLVRVPGLMLLGRGGAAAAAHRLDPAKSIAAKYGMAAMGVTGGIAFLLYVLFWPALIFVPSFRGLFDGVDLAMVNWIGIGVVGAAVLYGSALTAIYAGALISAAVGGQPEPFKQFREVRDLNRMAVEEYRQAASVERSRKARPPLIREAT